MDTLITTKEAADLAKVSSAAISNWATRGYLTAEGVLAYLRPSSRDSQGRPLYRVLDVAKAENATRGRARRTLAG